MITIGEFEEALQQIRYKHPGFDKYYQILGPLPTTPKCKDLNRRQWRRNRYKYKLQYLIKTMGY